jgi:hypothetical protein
MACMLLECDKLQFLNRYLAEHKILWDNIETVFHSDYILGEEVSL